MNKKEEIMFNQANMIIDEICVNSSPYLKRYDGFVPLLQEDLFGTNDMFVEETYDVLERPLNITTFIEMDDGKSEFAKLYETTSKELRKRIGIYVSNPAIMERVHQEHGWKINNAKDRKKWDAHFSIVKNSKINFKYIDIPGTSAPSRFKNLCTLEAQTHAGLQFQIEQGWSIYIKPEDSSIGFTMLIDSLEQLKMFFKTRDIPDGCERRKALKHWVCEHLRRVSKNEDEFIKIKRYLRGQTIFNWYGMEIKIIPPVYMVNSA